MDNIERRFWFKVKLDYSDKCWVWQASTRNGYGVIGKEGYTLYAHRFSWQFFNGKIPDGMCVCHTCDNPLCVNPHHLFLGTQQDNMKDRQLKGRTAVGDKSGSRIHPENRAKGEQVGTSKLIDEQVIKIRQEYGLGNVTCRELAKKYHIAHTGILGIIHYRTWKHI